MARDRCPRSLTVHGLLPAVAAIACSVSLTGCSMSFWKTAEAAEESAVEPPAETETPSPDSVETPEESAATAQPDDQPTAGKAPSPELPDQLQPVPDQRQPAARPTRQVSIESELETLRASLSRTSSYRKLRTKKARAAFTKEAALQIDLGVAAADTILAERTAELDERREACKGRLTLLNRGEQLKLPDFAERLDRAVAEATSQPDLQSEAEYGSGLILVNRRFKSGQITQTLESLQEHARAFPEGSSTARLFLTFARDCGEQGKFGAGILCCKLALWQLNNHPDIEAVRNLLENLQAGRTVDPSQDRVQQLLQKEVAVLRHELPIKVDKVTTCTAITTSYHAVTYCFRVSLDPSFVKANEDKIKSSITQMAQTTYQTQHLLEQGITLHYVYFDGDGVELLRFSVTK